ncbi:MAG TPA: M50 family metallopeptidase [Chthonomonadaceae bacterium]|nr:M50 family metallopeptidase [Chthonomonadaceae bacterium]
MNTNLPDLSSLSPPARAAGSVEGPRNGRQLLLWATVATVALWFLPFSNYLLYPLRLFVTFIHESGHAVAAELVGGHVASLQIHPDGSGITWTAESPWFAWLVLSAGYIGAALFGALLLQAGRLTGWRNAGRTTLYASAALILIVTLLWGWHSLFTLLVGLALTALLGAAGRYVKPQWADFLASFLAVQCCLGALGDLRTLFYLTTYSPGTDNDAVFMAQHYALPAAFWAVTWAVMAVAILALSLRSFWRATARQKP